MTEVFWKVSIYPHGGKFHVVCEWSDTCALTLTRDTLEQAFEAIRKEFAQPREFSLIPFGSLALKSKELSDEESYVEQQ